MRLISKNLKDEIIMKDIDLAKEVEKRTLEEFKKAVIYRTTYNGKVIYMFSFNNRLRVIK